MIDHVDARSWRRSTLSISGVGRLLAEHYGFEPDSCLLVRSFVNDVYRVEHGGRSLAVKFYGTGRWSDDEVRWEQELSRQLSAEGLPVPRPAALLDGDLVGVLDAPEGRRPFTLSDWLPGKPPQPPWSDSLYRELGRTAARFHLAADSFSSTRPRRPVRTGLERSAVEEALGDDPRRQLVRRAGAAAEEQVARLAGMGLRRGVRHGDVSLDNIHVGDQGLQLYDLDLAGPGWPSEDLVGALSTPFAEAFLDGYARVRTLSALEQEALGWLQILSAVDNLYFHLVTKPTLLGTATLAEGWVEEAFDDLRRAASDQGVRG